MNSSYALIVIAIISFNLMFDVFCNWPVQFIFYVIRLNQC